MDSTDRRGRYEWNQKLSFPVHLPTYNDKVVIKMLYSYGAAYLPLWSSENLLGNIPEKPSRMDIFNISDLLSKEGKMEPQWINIYGVRQQDGRDDGTQRPTSAWLGRVLLSLALVKNERPQLKKDSQPSAAEPKTTLYEIQADVLQLFNCKELLKREAGKKMRVEVHMRDKSGKSGHGTVSKNVVEWTQKKGAISEIEFEQNKEPDFRTDMFVYLTADDKRVGFIRIDQKEYHDRATDRPTWFNVLSMDNAQIIGQLLIALRMPAITSKDNKPDRLMVTRSLETKYCFSCQIISGYEIASNLGDPEIETHIRVDIGHKKVRFSTAGFGNFPLYNFADVVTDVTLHKELAFTPNLAVRLMRGPPPS